MATYATWPLGGCFTPGAAVYTRVGLRVKDKVATLHKGAMVQEAVAVMYTKE